MLRSKVFGVIAFTLVFVACFAGLGNSNVKAEPIMQVSESKLTLNDADQQNPDIYEYGYNNYAVVWQDNRNGLWDIYMYYQEYLGDGRWISDWDRRITANAGNNLNPKIYDKTIVYQSDRNGNWDIYMYDLTTNTETQITTNTANQGPAAIYGDIIVWQDWRNVWRPSIYLESYPGMSIYMYNLATQTEERLPLPKQACFSPSISGDLVVYAGEDYGTYPYSGIHYYTSYVSAYNLVTEGTFDVAAAPKETIPASYQPRAVSLTAIDGSMMAWTGFVGDFRVTQKDLASDVIWGKVGLGGLANPDVSGNYIAYQCWGSDWDVYLHDITTNVDQIVTSSGGHQMNPAVCTGAANFIVYMDYRSGNWDIYLGAFWYSVMGGDIPDPPITPSKAVGELQETKELISNVPTESFAGVNTKVQESRKNVLLKQLDSAISSIEAAANTENLRLRSKYLQSAIDQLSGLIVKLDGFSLRYPIDSDVPGAPDVPGSGFTPDWIKTPSYFDQVIRSVQNDLQTLLNGVT